MDGYDVEFWTLILPFGLWSQSFGVFDVGRKSAVELRLAVRVRAQLGGGGG